MMWLVRFHDAFEAEFDAMAGEVREELAATAKLLQDCGPKLGRPHVDTLNGSQFSNMKELRFRVAGGVWRVAFAFDPNREGILLMAGDKSGGSEDKFYRRLIAKADERYAGHLAAMKKLPAKKG
ncbi:MAG: type II toxin-antitoxin system RelE/ParE family toxin [Alphaproteobacteria bacterium]|nr:type II toxin-antitoxin system RelE/ParE family toxin [Alphaproteobacteria bacterium]